MILCLSSIFRTPSTLASCPDFLYNTLMEKSLTIESLAYQGYGVGRADDGLVWFVPYTVPGDKILAEAMEEKKKFVFGRIKSIEEPSPRRREASCPHFENCGGCHWQTTEYEDQLEAKRAILGETFKRAGMALEALPEAVGAPEEYGYRNRIQLRFSPKGEPGFFKRESHEIIPIRNCPLADPVLNDRLALLWKETDATLSGAPGKGPAARYPNGVELRLKQDGSVEEIPLEKRKEAEYDFSQVNRGVNEKLKERLIALVNRRFPEKSLRVMDLYCGNGNLSLALLDRAARIRGWDSSVGACDEGMRRAKELGAVTAGDGAQVRYFSRSLDKSIDAIIRESAKADILLVDPPRKGIKDDKHLFRRLKVPMLLYVSCSPPTLARDVASLKARGYRLEEMILFDMFPQTYHMETLAVLVREDSSSTD